MNFADHVNADARLIILRELASQPGGRLNSSLLMRVLEAFGHNRSKEWLESQLHALDEIGAITARPVGTVIIAQLMQAGLDHVERRRVLADIARPSIVSG